MRATVTAQRRQSPFVFNSPSQCRKSHSLSGQSDVAGQNGPNRARIRHCYGHDKAGPLSRINTSAPASPARTAEQRPACPARSETRGPPPARPAVSATAPASGPAPASGRTEPPASARRPASGRSRTAARSSASSAAAGRRPRRAGGGTAPCHAAAACCEGRRRGPAESAPWVSMRRGRADGCWGRPTWAVPRRAPAEEAAALGSGPPPPLPTFRSSACARVATM